MFFPISPRGTLFVDKCIIHIEWVFLEATEDLTMVNRWSWGGMVLAHLYHYLHESTLTGTRTMGGNVILLTVLIYLCLFITFLMVINYNCVCLFIKFLIVINYNCVCFFARMDFGAFTRSLQRKPNALWAP